MKDERQTIHLVEIIPPEEQRSSAGGARGQFSAPTAQPLPPLLRTMIMVAAIAAGIGLLALLVMFAATVALVAVPAALVAGGVAWLGMRWRSWRGRG
jgi:hypothetical protein